MKFGYSVGDAVRDDKLHINYPDAMVEESERCAIRGQRAKQCGQKTQ
jgi:hypothetical protein